MVKSCKGGDDVDDGSVQDDGRVFQHIRGRLSEDVEQLRWFCDSKSGSLLAPFVENMEREYQKCQADDKLNAESQAVEEATSTCKRRHAEGALVLLADCGDWTARYEDGEKQDIVCR